MQPLPEAWLRQFYKACQCESFNVRPSSAMLSWLLEPAKSKSTKAQERKQKLKTLIYGEICKRGLV